MAEMDLNDETTYPGLQGTDNSVPDDGEMHTLLKVSAEHVATLELYRLEDGSIKGWMRIADEDGALMDVPTMYAQQLPQAFAMMKAMQNG